MSRDTNKEIEKNNWEYQLDKHIENIEFGTGMGGTIGSLQRAEQGMRDFVRNLLQEERKRTLEEVEEGLKNVGCVEVQGNDLLDGAELSELLSKLKYKENGKM